MSMSCVMFAGLMVRISGHANLMIPVPRNSNDRDIMPFKDGGSPATPCTCANGVGGGEQAEHDGCDVGPWKENGGRGQACLWWSQGCSIHCDFCVTDPPGGQVPTTPITGNHPHADKAGFRKSYCKQNMSKPWTLPRKAWTMNVNAVECSEEDSYRFNPWRAPGSAPVVDPCGQAGGKFRATPMGGDSVFTDTKQAQMGDMGSEVLKPVPLSMQPIWEIGSAVDVAWGMRYNHGGGYQYRLCPADEPLTEACFQNMPLEFVKSEHKLLWNNGSVLEVLGEAKGVFVSGVGVTFGPPGSTWARNPVPRVNTDNIGLANEKGCNQTEWPYGRDNPICQQFKALCSQDIGTYPRCSKTQGWPCSYDGSGQGACSGDWTADLIADKVVIPKHLKPGKYILGWRWDCEETAQVWQNCADVNIVAAGSNIVV
eukprot:TRINITY_DN21659_c0_g1_i1.p1 TRINITY_DN21659_c0_g1~~TRINITY_DN21659_c0_g1_i1.p1  ORF type:complete len:426 (+),score=29.75 TRINITY_DN21659_c0_g1_i1:74-1351(+)